jgi:hypothetical protein
VWRYVLAADALGQEPTEPAWFSRPAIGRVTVSDPRTLALFKNLNKGKPYADQIKPQNFMLSAQAETLPPEIDPTQPFHLVAPYNPDPRQWLKLRWVDRYSGRSYRVTTGDAMSEGVVRIKTYRDVVTEYRRHAEHKSLAPDGQPCSPTSAGLLRRRPVEAMRVVYTGKESNRLEDVLHGLIADEDEVTNEYRDPNNDPFVLFVVPVLKSMRRERLVALSDMHADSVKRILAGRVPRAKVRERLTSIAAEHARKVLSSRGDEVPKSSVAVLHRCLEVSRGGQRTCPMCGEPVTSARATYCGARCRVRANRRGGHGVESATARHDTESVYPGC